MSVDYYKKNFFIYIQCKASYVSESIQYLLENPDFFLDNPATQIIQDNFKSKLGVVSIDGRKVVIKRHNYKSLWHRFRRYFRRTRSQKNWIMSHILLENRIWVPAPVAYVETRIGCLRGKSFFIYEYVDGVTGEEYFKQHIDSDERIDQGMNMVVELLRRIKELGYIHGDIRMSNLVFTNNQLCLLDLDDIKPITWYQVRRVRTRDVRGLKKDIFYNIPPSLQERFLQCLEGL